MADEQPAVSASEGSEFQIELDSRPGTGAIWYLKSSTGPELVRQETDAKTNDAGGVTAQKFIFRANRPGSHEIEFELKRPWEKEVRRRVNARVNVN
jgi:predicted secreted protein